MPHGGSSAPLPGTTCRACAGASSNPSLHIHCCPQFSVSLPRAGVYYISITANGDGADATTGYTSYGSRGMYQLQLTYPSGTGDAPAPPPPAPAPAPPPTPTPPPPTTPPPTVRMLVVQTVLGQIRDSFSQRPKQESRPKLD